MRIKNLETSRKREVALLLVARKTPKTSKTPKSVRTCAQKLKLPKG